MTLIENKLVTNEESAYLLDAMRYLVKRDACDNVGTRCSRRASHKNEAVLSLFVEKLHHVVAAI